MKDQKLNDLQDLILKNCPLGCDGNCAGIWVNQITGHRIACMCENCKHSGNVMEKRLFKNMQGRL
jgi:hypothetical protein